jgi:hypothetical protein
MKTIKHFNLKFISTIIFGMICGLLPLIIFGTNAVIFGMGTGLAGTMLMLIIFF